MSKPWKYNRQSADRIVTKQLSEVWLNGYDKARTSNDPKDRVRRHQPIQPAKVYILDFIEKMLDGKGKWEIDE